MGWGSLVKDERPSPGNLPRPRRPLPEGARANMASAAPAALIDELHHRPAADELRDRESVPVGHAHAAVRADLAHLGGLGGAMDAVGLLAQRNPDRTDRI